MSLSFYLTGQGVSITDELREHVARRLDFALGRFAERVERIEVKVEDVNGVDKQCRIHVMLRGMPSVHVGQTAEVAYAAVDRAADRIGRTVARKLDRRITPPRGHALRPL